MSIVGWVAEDGATGTTATARGTVERVEPTKAQRALARRVAESKATAPHLYMEIEIHTRDAPVERLVHAAARALRETPRLNGAYRDGAFELYSRVNVGVVLEGVEAPVVPTVFDADTKSPAEIAGELSRLKERAAAGALTSPEVAGGTFTITLAAGSIRALAPILNQGQAAGLGIGPVLDRAVARDGDVVAVPALTATLSCDARMVDAGEGARFLDELRAILEAPG